ncbi:MAG TPA: DinB family protein, partial [Chryseolinea sp.]
MGIEDFNRTIDIWIKALDHYDFQQLIKKPSFAGWSIGQVFMHLLDDTSFYIRQMEICVTNDDH